MPHHTEYPYPGSSRRTQLRFHEQAPGVQSEKLSMKTHLAGVSSVLVALIFYTLFCLLFLIVLRGCYPSATRGDMQAAIEGVETALAQIPAPPDLVTVLKVVTEEFDDGEFRDLGERVCAFARRYVIIGSTQSIDEVVLAYTSRLELVGYQLKGRQYAHSATLYRDERDSAEIGYLPGSTWISRADEELWQAQYATVAQLYLQTIVPGRRACDQWSADELREPYAVPSVTPRSK